MTPSSTKIILRDDEILEEVKNVVESENVLRFLMGISPQDGNNSRSALGGSDALADAGDPNVMIRAKSILARTVDCSSDIRYVHALLEGGVKDRDRRIRGMAWLLVADMWGEARAAAIVQEVGRFIDVHPDLRPEPGIAEKASRFWLETLERGIQHWRKMAGYRGAEAEWVRYLAAEDFPLLNRDPLAAEEFLAHPDPSRRLAAVMLLRRLDGNPHSVIERIAMLANADPEPSVRCVAVMATGRFYSKTRNPRALGMLAEIVLKDAETVHVRANAYQALFVVDDRPSEEFPLVRTKGDCTLCLESVDWHYVRSAARTGPS